jgi:hypothetical protein
MPMADPEQATSGRYVTSALGMLPNRGNPSRPEWRIVRGHPAHAQEIREWIGGAAREHGCGIDPAEATLAVSELFTNALIHGPSGGRVLVGYWLLHDGMRLVVCDAGGPTTPRIHHPAGSEEGGRGLQIVNAVATAWGSFRAGRARVVWCDLGAVQDECVGAHRWGWVGAVLITGLLAGRGMPSSCQKIVGDSSRR